MLIYKDLFPLAKKERASLVELCTQIDVMMSNVNKLLKRKEFLDAKKKSTTLRHTTVFKAVYLASDKVIVEHYM